MKTHLLSLRLSSSVTLPSARMAILNQRGLRVHTHANIYIFIHLSSIKKKTVTELELGKKSLYTPFQYSPRSLLPAFHPSLSPGLPALGVLFGSCAMPPHTAAYNPPCRDKGPRISGNMPLFPFEF